MNLQNIPLEGRKGCLAKPRAAREGDQVITWQQVSLEFAVLIHRRSIWTTMQGRGAGAGGIAGVMDTAKALTFLMGQANDDPHPRA